MKTIFLHGFATAPEIWPGGGPKISFENIEAEAIRIGTGIDQSVCLVGWSMGGMVALRIAVLFPEKVKKLILVSTTPKFLKSTDFPFGLSPALLRKLKKDIKAKGASAFHALIFANSKPSGLAYPSIEQMEKELAELARIDLRMFLLQIKPPTLIIHGDQDGVCLPEAAEYMKLEIKNSKLEILGGVGHAPMIEVPKRFKELVDGFSE